MMVYFLDKLNSLIFLGYVTRILSLITLIYILFILFSQSVIAEELFKPRIEQNWRLGSERSILMSEIWAPIYQNSDQVVYGDLRLMGDDEDNREGNIGLGYRHYIKQQSLEAIAGVHGWFDRRITDRGSTFNQFTFGTEWLGKSNDIRINGYYPISDKEIYEEENKNPSAPSFSGTGIFVDTNRVIIEEPQKGLDLEFGWEMGAYSDFIKKNTDSTRLYGGFYHFESNNTESVSGWRARAAVDITQNFQTGLRFQKDDERGSQGFLELTVRFPFDAKKSFREESLRARFDESPERDIDIVSNESVSSSGDEIAVINKETNQAQEILFVDNTAASGGNGSAEQPFNSLSEAQAAASAHTIIYLKAGDGTDFNQDQGIILNKTGQQLIGSGVDFIFDSSRFTTANNKKPLSSLLATATTSPVISNINSDGDGIQISADNVNVAGLVIDGANAGGLNRDGIVIEADGDQASAQNVKITNVQSKNNRHGIYINGADGGKLSASVENSSVLSNRQHGIAIYDDTENTFEVDLGGGRFNSAGHNSISGNTLEDLALEYDGRTLSALNNWWGQNGGPIARNLYFGAPLNDDLIMHWTFDNETAFDRSGRGYDGTLTNNPTPVNGELDFNAVDEESVEGVDISESETGSELTILFFMTPESLSLAQTLISKWERANGGNENSWAIRSANADGSNLFFFVADTSDMGDNFFISSDANLAAGEKAHIGFVFNGNNGSNADRLKAFKNAEQLNGTFSGTIPATLHDSNQAVRAGFPLVLDPTYGKPYDGLIDDMRIYQRALDVQEIQQLYRANTSSQIQSSNPLSSAP